MNAMGVDINRAVNDPYYQLLLPYIAGLGPRKAQVLIKKIIKLVSYTSFSAMLIDILLLY